MSLLINRTEPVVTAEQMRSIDRYVIEELGLPSLCLMENAGRAVAEACWRRLCRRPGSVLIFCGRGNNGGDGLVAARHLLARRVDVRIELAAPPESLQGDAAIQARVLIKSGVRMSGPWARRKGTFPSRMVTRRTVLVVDALFGVGLKRPLEGVYAQAVEIINRSGRPVIAVDVPSGLDATTGQVWGKAVKADATVTMGCCKRGLLNGEGPFHSGKIIVADLGVPASVMRALLRGRL